MQSTFQPTDLRTAVQAPASEPDPHPYAPMTPSSSWQPCVDGSGNHILIDRGYSFDASARRYECECGLRKIGNKDESRYRLGLPVADGPPEPFAVEVCACGQRSIRLGDVVWHPWWAKPCALLPKSVAVPSSTAAGYAGR